MKSFGRRTAIDQFTIDNKFVQNGQVSKKLQIRLDLQLKPFPTVFVGNDRLPMVLYGSILYNPTGLMRFGNRIQRTITFWFQTRVEFKLPRANELVVTTLEGICEFVQAMFQQLFTVWLL